MARDTVNAKCRLCRREGSKLFLKGDRCFSAKCPLEKKGAVVPGMHGLKRAGRLSGYGVQLRAKQKVKRYYGVLERQMANYYKKSKKMAGMAGYNLLSLLETRLDNVVYASGFSLSRCHAKQMISHQWLKVNGKAVNINSYQLKIADLISFKKQSKISSLQIRANQADFKPPLWLEIDKDKYTIKIIRLPTREEIPQEFDENLIIEYYSR